MSFIQKSLWGQLAIFIIIGIYYFTNTLELIAANILSGQSITWLLLKLVIFKVVLYIVYHTIIAAIHVKEANKHDERDKLIDLYGSRSAYHTLTAVVVILLYMIWQGPIQDIPFTFALLPDAYNLLHLLLMGFFLAEIIKIVTQLYYYKRGF
ncbi:hypothetical protein AAD001_12245 [Colwelliaceae bacterium 6471]